MVVVENFTTSSSVRSSLDYGNSPRKAGKTIGIGCSDDKNQAIKDLSTPAELYSKGNDKVQLHRFVVSFANTDDGKSELNDNDSYNYVNKILNTIDKSLDGNFPIFAVQNTNTDYNHYHVYMSACGLDGRKFHPKKNPISFCRNLNNNLSLSYGLRPVSSYQRDYKDISQYTDDHIEQYSQKNHGFVPYGYKDDGRQKISRAILKSSNLREFRRRMFDQGCITGNNIFNSNKMLNIYLPYRYKSGLPRKPEHEKKQDYRNLRTRTLGEEYFSKESIKKAISSQDSNVLAPYKYFARDMKTVQGGKHELQTSNSPASPAILVNHPAKVRMKNVPYVDDKMNHVNILTYGKNSFKNIYGINNVMQPNLSGFDSEEKHEIIEQYKTYEQICRIMDDFFSSDNGIFHDFSYSISKITDELIDNRNHQNIDMKFHYDTSSIKYNHQGKDKIFNIFSSNKSDSSSFIGSVDRNKRVKDEEDSKSKTNPDPLGSMGSPKNMINILNKGMTSADRKTFENSKHRSDVSSNIRNKYNQSSKFKNSNIQKKSKRKSQFKRKGPKM